VRINLVRQGVKIGGRNRDGQEIDFYRKCNLIRRSSKATRKGANRCAKLVNGSKRTKNFRSKEDHYHEGRGVVQKLNFPDERTRDLSGNLQVAPRKWVQIKNFRGREGEFERRSKWEAGKS